MRSPLEAHDAACDTIICVLLRVALAVDTWRLWVSKSSRLVRGSLKKLTRTWERWRGVEVREEVRRRRAWNRTPESVEADLVGLHIAHRHLGVAQLARLALRVLGLKAAKETVRKILKPRKALIEELEDEVRRRRRRISVKGALELWGMDFTLVWVLGFFPAWVFGVVEYHGSRLVAFERVAGPTSEEARRVLEQAFARWGVPARLLCDNGAAFRARATGDFLDARGVKQSFIRPGHSWTNGRIERIFRTFKETVYSFIWMFSGRRQLDRFCADFLQWHNRDRPHARWAGRTPDEVYFGRKRRQKSVGAITYFDGLMPWHRFG